MPIYSEYPPHTERVTYENFINLERVPTASVLLRVAYTAIDDKGNFISVKDPNLRIASMAFEPAPEYSEVAYSTTYYLTTGIEREVFKIRKQRKIDAPLKKVLQAVCSAPGVELTDDKDMVVYFAKRLANVSSLRMIDLCFFSTYAPEVGFRYNLYALHGAVEKHNIFSVLGSVSPPSSPYQDNNRSMLAAFPFT